MNSEITYESIDAVINDPKFPETDCVLRTGRHIGVEDISTHAFIRQAFRPLYHYYSRFKCELVHEPHQESDYYFLSNYGDILPKRRLSRQEMIVGMIIAYMLTDPQYISREIPFEEIIDTLKIHIGGEERFREIMSPRRRGKNTEGDEQKAREKLQEAIRKLEVLGFLKWPKNRSIRVFSPIFRFLGPVRSIGNIHENIKTLLERGLVEIDQLIGEDEELEGELEC
jgi:chromosome partition protein MukE